ERDALELAAHELGLVEAAPLEAPRGQFQLPEAGEAEVGVLDLRLGHDGTTADGAEAHAGEAAGVERDRLQDGVGEVHQRQLAAFEGALRELGDRKSVVEGEW